MKTDWKSLCAELYGIFEKYDDESNLAGIYWDMKIDKNDVLDRARAALARGGHPAPVPVSEPIAWLWEYIGSDPYPHKFSPVARSLREMDPANPPFPDDWRPVAPLYLARWGRPASLPIAVSERLPERIERALIKAECALSDIAEGEAEESEGDALEWAEKRAADALARIRPVMRQHQIQTSEWPPLPAHALPLPAGEVEPNAE